MPQEAIQPKHRQQNRPDAPNKAEPLRTVQNRNGILEFLPAHAGSIFLVEITIFVSNRGEGLPFAFVVTISTAVAGAEKSVGSGGGFEGLGWGLDWESGRGVKVGINVEY